MCCYVGKATKIFLCLVSVLLVVGLVLGFGLAHRTWGARRAQPACRWPECQAEPVDGDPLPATAATTPPNPLTQPAVAAFPGAASSSAAPPASMPYFGPPSPFAEKKREMIQSAFGEDKANGNATQLTVERSQISLPDTMTTCNPLSGR